MFRDSKSFNQPLDQWDVSNVSVMLEIFGNTQLDNTNYDLTLIGWSKLNVKNGVNIGVDGLTFCAVEARNILKNNFNWNFDGDIPGLPSSSSFQAISAGWYDDTNLWSTMEYPSFCTEVTIPVNKGVQINTGNAGVANVLEVELGGTLEVVLGGELIVEP